MPTRNKTQFTRASKQRRRHHSDIQKNAAKSAQLKAEIAQKTGLMDHHRARAYARHPRRYGMPENTPGHDLIDSLYKEFKKDKAVALDVAGYDEFFLMEGGTALAIEEDTGLDDELAGAKVATIRKAFAKNARGKLSGRAVLGRFIDMIAT